jgi:hypothetical protein
MNLSNPGGATRSGPSPLEQLAVVTGAALFFFVVFFRDGAPVYGRDKVAGAFVGTTS